MRRKQEFRADLLEVVIKGHKLTPWIDAAGTFFLELEDGEVLSANTLADLRQVTSERVSQAAKEVKPYVDCYLLRGWSDDKVQPAVYVGRRKGSNDNWAHCFMFDVGPSNGKQQRENLSKDGVERRCLKPDMDVTTLLQLQKNRDVATKAVEDFLKKNRFDPTK